MTVVDWDTVNILNSTNSLWYWRKELIDHHWKFLEQQLITLKFNKGKELNTGSAFPGQTVFQSHYIVDKGSSSLWRIPLIIAKVMIGF